MNIKYYQSAKFALVISLLFLYLQPNYAQDENFWSKVRFGGNVGIGFSNNTFNAIVAPAVVYEFNQWFSGGVGLHLGYSSFDDNNLNQEGSSFTYGGSIIGLFNPIRELQLSAEFEEIGVSQSIEVQGQKFTNDYWYPALFVGAGYRTGFVSFGIRYDLLYDSNKSIYVSAYVPFVRVFF